MCNIGYCIIKHVDEVKIKTKQIDFNDKLKIEVTCLKMVETGDSVSICDIEFCIIKLVLTELHSKGRLLALPESIRLGWKILTMASTLAYHIR